MHFDDLLDSNVRRLKISNSEIESWSHLPPILTFVENDKYYTCEYCKLQTTNVLIPGAAFGMSSESVKSDQPFNDEFKFCTWDFIHDD